MREAQRNPAVIHYRVEGNLRAIDVSVDHISQLFSGLDPSPFGQKDLDGDVHSYIIAAVEEIGGPEKVKLLIHFPAEELPLAADLPTAFHNFFAYRAWANTRDLHRLLRIGYASLAIGLLFLAICLLLQHAIPDRPTNALYSILSEGLVIVGWVALWRPLEIFLYEWWPIWRRKRLHLALTRIPVECRVR